MTGLFARKASAGVIILLFIGTAMLTPLSARQPPQTHSTLGTTELLDIGYIYNITKALSDIVTTAYRPGEIAKGRQFGTPGEHLAAQILHDNMSQLGLDTTYQYIHDLPLQALTQLMNITSYGLTLHHRGTDTPVDCYIGYNRLTYPHNASLSYTGLQVRTQHPTGLHIQDYVLIRPKTYRTIGFGPFPSLEFKIRYLKNMLNDTLETLRHPHWRGTIIFDANDSCHDMPGMMSPVPTININGSTGRQIHAAPDDYTVDFHITQAMASVNSSNVIGQLNGTDPTKTVIVDCLYDGWWNQATADSAIGMGIVLGVAKYFHDQAITPHYTIKFIAFAGEEEGMRGATYYAATHPREDIIAVIDLNQLGFTQTSPRLTLQIAANSQRFLDTVMVVASRTDYKNRTGNVTDIEPMVMPLGHISDDHSFALQRPYVLPFRGIDTVCFLKNGLWLMHHRDGVNHMQGDAIGQFNWTDVGATGEMILNTTRSLAQG